MKLSGPGALLLLLPASLSAAADGSISYSRDIVPILRTNCISCHKPGKTKGGLDLTTHMGLLKGGDEGGSIKAGDAKGSRLIDTICGEEPEMPKDGEPLLPREIQIISRWIDQGAMADEATAAGTKLPAEPPVYQSLPAVHALSFSPDGKFLAVPGRHEILLHRTDGSGIAARLPGDSPRLESLAFSGDGSLLIASGGAVSEFGEIQIWDPAQGKLVRSIKASHDSFYGVSISPDNQRVAVGCADKLVRVFTIADGKETMRCDNHLDWVFGSAFTNDGLRLATVSRDKAAKLIDTTTGQLIDDINQARDPLICLQKHPREDLLATGGTEGKIRLFRMEARGGRLSEGDNKENSFVREFEHMASPIYALAFSPDGSRIACGGESGEVRIFNSGNGQRVSHIKNVHRSGSVFALAFTADGKYLATGGYDGHIRFHGVEKGEIVKDLAGFPLQQAVKPPPP
jgi:WD40 repeat protein